MRHMRLSAAIAILMAGAAMAPAQAGDNKGMTLFAESLSKMTCADLSAYAQRDLSESIHMLGLIIEDYAHKHDVDFTPQGVNEAMVDVAQTCAEQPQARVMGILEKTGR